MDLRRCYAEVKTALMNPQLKKVVFILHSQGGIEGGMVLDWLLADVPGDLLKKLEIYTFGCAANHFNNPLHSKTETPNFLDYLTRERIEQDERIVRYIEHYANSDDFVCKWGVLNFISSSTHRDNRFVGQLFKREGSGHQFNQHYLDNMFPLAAPGGPVKDDCDFVNMLVDVEEETAIGRENLAVDCLRRSSARGMNGDLSAQTTVNADCGDASSEYVRAARANAANVRKKTVGELSRLWQYRNGGSPEDK